MTEEEKEKLKKTELEILDAFDKVCRENNLTYFLFGGTLLGAVRHGGFIPWDDDIDVVMPREDLNRLSKIANEVFGDKYYLQMSEDDAAYPMMQAKLRKNGTVFEESVGCDVKSHKGIFIDIFPLDKLDAVNMEKAEKRCKKAKLLTSIITYKSGYKSGMKKKTKLFAHIYALQGIKRIKEKRLKLMTKDNGSKNVNTVCVIASNYNWKKQLVDENVYFPPSKVVFEGKEYMAPNNIEAYLTSVYGDYMKLPPVEKRVTRHPIVNLEFGEEKKKYKIGYTTGVFDLFHIGHLNILKRAKEQCDFLVVGVSTDEVVQTYKNKKPVIPFENRVKIVEAIKYVDKVVPQKTLDKSEMWDELRFNAVFHGDDWKGSNLYDEMEKKLKDLGVDMVFLPHTDGVSSTMIMQDIQK